jgi:2'-5' RNA ligase
VRLFLAVNLPPDLRDVLWSAAEPLRAGAFPIRWVAPDGLHITMKFLGHVDADRVPGVRERLDRAVVGAKPFSLLLSGFGAFPSPRRPRIVWAGCEPAPPLELLQDRVEREMQELGFPVEARVFHPHVTVGRVKRGAKAQVMDGLEGRLANLTFHEEFTVQSVDLMESTLHPSGARYACRHAAALRG